MFLIVGLGNKGEKYARSRHNVGFMVVDKIAKDKAWQKSKYGNLLYAWVTVGKSKIELVKPQTYMNNSGNAVAYAIKKHPELKLNNLYVIHDDLDIALGSVKIQKGKGPRLHGGVMSIEGVLGSVDFWRVRVGVENRRPENKIPGVDYVLQNFLIREIEVINKVTDEAVERLWKVILKQ